MQPIFVFAIRILVVASILWGATEASAQLCSPGQFSATGQEPCTDCSAGTFSGSPGATQCDPCPAGSFAAVSGQSSCTACAPGTAQPNIGSLQCPPCGPGTFEPDPGSTACDECPGGQSNPCNGNGTCDDGPTGSGTCSCFVGYTGVACENTTSCQPGFFSATGNEPCTACTPGTFAASSGSTACTQCAPGSATATSGSASCTPCSPGSAQPLVGTTSCNPCGPGTYEPDPGSTTCDECPGGQAAPCNLNGTCDDGPTGTGTCSCFPGYVGVACETQVTTTTAPPSSTTTLPGSCAAAPEVGCLTAAKAQLQIAATPDPAKRQLKWKWSNGQQLLQPALGDPSTTTEYVLCIYDTSAAVASHVGEVVVAPNASWQDKDPKGWILKDKTGVQDGVRKLQLKTGSDGKSKAQLAAKGAAVPLPPALGGGAYFDQDPEVVVQLVSSDGTCLTSTFAAADAKKNTEASFKASVK